MDSSGELVDLHAVELLRRLTKELLAILERHVLGHDLVRVPETRVRERGLQ